MGRAGGDKGRLLRARRTDIAMHMGLGEVRQAGGETNVFSGHLMGR